jgi:Domain of unknown function (DUF6815)
MRVGLLWRGDPHAPPPSIENNRLRGVFDALSRRGVEAVPVVYADDVVEDVRERLAALDGVLVWVDPTSNGGDRSKLDPMLRDVATRGVWVSAHPDIILKMGTKEVLYLTRDMGWGTDTRLYTTFAEFRDALPKVLADGRARVLKQYRSNGGNGVWKVEAAGGEPIGGSPPRVRARHALRGSVEEEMTLDEFLERCALYFDGDGRLIDQPYQPRLVDGIVRCYLVNDRVAGFGEQLINALFPAPPGVPASDSPQPGPRLYYPPTRSDFQPLKRILEAEWIPELCRRLAIVRDDLPAIWDADFLYGPKRVSGDDTYVLCEINVSAVFPFPDSALEPLADAVIATLRGRGINKSAERL